ncbi:MAG TPA: undecaprenyl-diphosphate phosphatase [Tepidisphaeraceae bacterium]|jgi:undecaprenyl pyrophosphate phosphatase UppP|nr:undecaprenyl-diphosphate phosphatase [Tepidisphaeraceae bacterium]
MLTLTQIIILAVIQGMAELLPVSSSAHVIAAARLMHIRDTASPQFTIMLVMLHTGTMFAVIAYFWSAWRKVFFASKDAFARFATKVIVATAATGIVGFPLIKGIEMYLDPGYTTLMSQGLVEIGSKSASPTASTRVTQLAATYQRKVPLFKIGDTLTLQATKGSDELPVSTVVVTPTSTVQDLLGFYRQGLAIDANAPAKPNGLPPGATLKADSENPSAVLIQIVGNPGSENRLKLGATGFVNQNGESPLAFSDEGKAEIEQLFKRLDLSAVALAAAGLLIFYSGLHRRAQRYPRKGITTMDSVSIGAIQGVCLPFRGFSRSGATISVGLLRGVARQRLEEFSFALAVVLTPIVIGREALRLITHHEPGAGPVGMHAFVPSLIGMGCSFVAGIMALAILSKLLEKGQWWIFGVYCLLASGGMFWMYLHGY